MATFQEVQIDGAALRSVLAHVPTPVAVVTASGEGPVGMTVGSFTSVSLDPPLVGFFVTRTSSTWPRIRASGTFCVNILAASQAELCRLFASKDADRFSTATWSPAPSGAPLLAGVAAWTDCTLHEVVDAGDHELVLGRVEAMGADADALPLVFHRGGYPQLTPA